MRPTEKRWDCDIDPLDRSAYPTIQFLSWRGAVKRQLAPNISPQKLRAIRAVIHWELAGVVFIILFAVLMARGIA